MEDNGHRGNILKTRLNLLAEHIQNHPQLINELQCAHPAQIAMHLNQKNVTKHQLKLTQVLPQQNRLDKKDTGLQHTLVQSADQSTWFELFKTYDLNSKHDCRAMEKTHNNILVPQEKIQLFSHKTSTQIRKVTAIIGTGSIGVVVPARNIKNNEICAAKKTLNYVQAKKEFDNGQFLKKNLKAHTQADFITIDHIVKTVGSAKKIQKTKKLNQTEKVYLFSPLASQPDGHSQLIKNFNLRQSGFIQEFQQQNFKHITLMTHLVNQLEVNKLVHTDLKPENIFGEQIGDVGDIISEYGIIQAHSPAYTAPRPIHASNVLAGLDFATFNRFSLGVMIMLSITGELPTSKAIPELLRLPTSKDLYYTAGYPSKTIYQVPEYLSGKKLSFYDRMALCLAKRLMANDRRLALPENLDMQYWIHQLNQFKIQ